MKEVQPVPCSEPAARTSFRGAGRSMVLRWIQKTLLLGLVLASAAGPARGYGYTREEDPLLKSFEVAIRAARQRDVATAAAQIPTVRWQTDELKNDVRVDFEVTLRRAHGADATEAGMVQAWANLVYLALLQKFYWNLQEQVGDYHKARARLEAAQTYYELALAGNVRRNDEERRARDPKAPSRHDDIMRRFAAAREALGSPGLFGSGSRRADPAAFRAAVVGIAGHLRAVFPGFVHPEAS